MISDVGILIAQVAIYYGVMLSLFRFRSTLGIGTFFCALCALTFAETYLAIGVFVAVGPIVYTPGSVLLFAGKLPLLLLAYIREDAETVRQPIYGLLIGNLMIVALLVFINMQEPADEGLMRGAITTVAESAGLSVLGTLLLFIDCIAVILLYEKVSRAGELPLFLRLWGTVAVVLALDHLVFFSALKFYFGVPLAAGAGGLIGKMVAAGVFSGLLWGYLRYVEYLREEGRHSLSDVFDVLTYRQRFEALHLESRTDPLTHARNRRAFLDEGPRAVQNAFDKGLPLGVLAVDIDHFKEVNDRYGHATGDAALRFLVELMMRTVRASDAVYRIGGDEFLILLTQTTQQPASRLANELKAAVETTPMEQAPGLLSVSVGWASLRDDGMALEELTAAADRRLYEAKAGRPPVAPGSREPINWSFGGEPSL